MNASRHVQPGSDDPADMIGGVAVATLAKLTGPCSACALNPGRPDDVECRRPKLPAVLYVILKDGGEGGCSGFKAAEGTRSEPGQSKPTRRGSPS